MKTSTKAFIIAMLLPLGLLTVQCDGAEITSSTPVPTAAGATLSTIETNPDVISADGIVVPVRRVRPSFTQSGQVEEVVVEVGDLVEAGQLLARMDTTSLEQALAQAEASLALAEAKLAKVRAAPKEEEIAVARANLDDALARLAQVQAAPDEEEVAVARANLAVARARLLQLKSPPCSQEMNAAKGAIEKAKVVMQLAQAEYDKIGWMEDAGASPQAIALQQATIDYEIAQANYAALMAGASAEEVATAECEIAVAQAQLRLAQQGASPEQIAIAESKVTAAQAQLRLVQQGPSAEEIALQEKEVALAELALEQARANLANATLAAPIGGTVTELMVCEGEFASAGTPVLELVDMSRWRVETNNLGELDIDRVRVGQDALVTVNAFLDDELTGKVIAISPTSIVQHGNTTYSVLVELQPTTLGLKWGMTAKVQILVQD